jgi:hypothetical protein
MVSIKLDVSKWSKILWNTIAWGKKNKKDYSKVNKNKNKNKNQSGGGKCSCGNDNCNCGDNCDCGDNCNCDIKNQSGGRHGSRGEIISKSCIRDMYSY